MAEQPFGGIPSVAETVMVGRHEHDLVPRPFTTQLPDGRVSIPAQQFAINRFNAVSGQQFVMLLMLRHQLVLHEALTPHGARVLAESLMRAADSAEAAMLEASNAQLAAALAKGKGA